MCVQCSHEQVVDLKRVIDLYSTNVKSCDHFFTMSFAHEISKFSPTIVGLHVDYIIFIFCTLLFLGIILRFKSYTSQWKCCTFIFKIWCNSTHRHDYCIERSINAPQKSW
jgi:hypothetical protein